MDSDSDYCGDLWWQGPTDEAKAERAYTTACEMADFQGGRRETHALFLRAYRSRVNAGYIPASGVLREMSSGGVLSLNVCRSVVNTMYSRVTKNKPKAMFLTTGGTATDRAKAKAYQFYTDGSFYRSKTYRRTKRAALNAFVFGDGFVRTSMTKRGIVDRSVLPINIIVDPKDAADGDPRQLHEIDWVDREVLMAEYPNAKHHLRDMDPEGLESAIEDMVHLNFDNGFGLKSRKVKVITSYHLRSSEDSDDGWMCVSVKGCVLKCEKWKYDRFPYSKLPWQDDPADFFGSGLVEELLGIQREINYTVRKIQLIIHLLSAPWILADRTAGVKKEQFNGRVGQLVLYNGGREPRVVAGAAVNPELFAHLDRLFQRAYSLVGVSESSTSGAPTAALRSGRGALVEDDKQTTRHATFEEAWEDFHNDIAEMHVLLGTAADGDYEVVAQDNQILREIKASELDLDRESWRIQRWPGSLMPDTPAGRIQTMEQLAQLFPGLPPDVMAEMLGDNDVKHHLRRLTAPINLCEKVIEAALEKGLVTSPDGHFPLDLLQKMAQEAYCLALVEGASQDDPNMKALRQTMVNARDVQVEAEMAMQQKQMAQAMAAQAGAMPPTGQAMPDPRLGAAGPAMVPPDAGSGAMPTDPSMM